MVVKLTRFFGHHLLLATGVGGVVKDKQRSIPLREYRRKLPEKGGIAVEVRQGRIEGASGQKRTRGREWAGLERKRGANYPVNEKIVENNI